MKPDLPKKPTQVSSKGPLKLGNGVPAAKKPTDNGGNLLIDLDDDWGDFTSNRVAPPAQPPHQPSQVSPGNSLPVADRIRMVLEALRNVLMMNPGAYHKHSTSLISTLLSF